MGMNIDKKKLGMEFFGVMVIVMVAFSGDQHPMLTGLTAGLMYTMAMGISGGHLNPAITLGLMATKKMDAQEGGQYIVAQILGGIAAFLMADIVLGETITISDYVETEENKITVEFYVTNTPTQDSFEDDFAFVRTITTPYFPKKPCSSGFCIC